MADSSKIPLIGSARLQQMVFGCLLIIYGSVILFTFQDYGITPDEEGHVRYGQSVIWWYTSFFQDQRIFSWTNTWLYGGFYDVVSHLATQISPMDTYETRHFFNAFFGSLGVVAAYKIGCLFGRGWAGCLAAVFLILTPRYYGHAFNNHKDIPFAVCYLWSVYGLMRGLDLWPQVRGLWVVGVGVAMGLTMGIRVGGVILFLYLGIFYGIKLWLLMRKSADRQTLGLGIVKIGVIFLIAYVVMILFWPWAQLNPLFHPFQALTVFSEFPIPFINFFEGVYLKSTDIPWYYASKWLLLTLPEFVLIGLFAGVFCIVLMRNEALFLAQSLQVGLLAFSGLFPLVYVAATHTPLYDAIRHMLFVIPPLVILSALGVCQMANFLRIRAWRYGFCSVVGVGLVWTLWQMVVLHPNQYIYYNHIFGGGLKTASDAYETDYLDNSYKEGVAWVETHLDTGGQRLKLASGTSSTVHLIDPARFEYVSVPTEADVYLITTRLERHRLVAGEVLHQVEADGIPILYVIRPDESFRQETLFGTMSNPYRWLIWGDFYEKIGRLGDAVTAYEEVIAYDAKLSVPYFRIGELYFSQNQYEQALSFYNGALIYSPNDAVALTRRGDCLAGLNRLSEAEKSYEQALRLRPFYLRALRNYAEVLHKDGRFEKAIKLTERALDVDPESVAFRQFLGLLLYDSGQIHLAEDVYRNLIRQAPDDPIAHYNLGMFYKKQNRYDDAITAFSEAAKRDSMRAEIYAALGHVLVKGGQKADAVQAFQRSLTLDPNQAGVLLSFGTMLAESGYLDEAAGVLKACVHLDAQLLGGWYMLGQIYDRQRKHDAAIQAYREVLKLDDNHMGAQVRLQPLTN